MSTRSYICIEKEQGIYEGIYCHWDGYLSNNGKLLNEFYQDRSKVEKLISLGDLSSLAQEIEPNPNEEHTFSKSQKDVCVFYGRDRGESGTEPRIVDLEELNKPDSWIEYVYIYTLENKWVYFTTYGEKDIELLDLEESINDLKEDE